MDANVESLENLVDNLKTQGYDLMQLPYVLQLNKRDLPSAVPVDELTAELLKKASPSSRQSRPTAREFSIL